MALRCKCHDRPVAESPIIKILKEVSVIACGNFYCINKFSIITISLQCNALLLVGSQPFKTYWLLDSGADPGGDPPSKIILGKPEEWCSGIKMP